MNKSGKNPNLFCYGCRDYSLDYPFVHQNCQHIVCATCSFGHKKDAYCIRCQRDQIAAGGIFVQAVKNGHSTQLGDILLRTCGTEVLNIKRHTLAETRPSAYSEATIQSSAVISVGSVTPITDQLALLQQQRPMGCIEGCFYYSFCCCIWKPLTRCGIRGLAVITGMLVVLLIIGSLNYHFTGRSDISNLSPWEIRRIVDDYQKSQQYTYSSPLADPNNIAFKSTPTPPPPPSVCEANNV